MKSNRQLSKEIGISEQLFCMIKNGDRNITYKLAKRLNKITRIEISFWMDANPEELKEALLQMRTKSREYINFANTQGNKATGLNSR